MASRRTVTTGLAATAAIALAMGALAAPGAAPTVATVAGVAHTFRGGFNPEAHDEAPMAVAPQSVDDVDQVGTYLALDRQARAIRTTGASHRWVDRGPFGIDMPPGYSQSGERFARVAGMAAAVASPPGHPDTVYAGNMGGLWRSTDAGVHWTNLSDGKFARVAVGAIALDPANPKVIYVGTGITFNSLSGDAVGSGIYVSRDGGRTFTRPRQSTRGYAVTQIVVTPKAVLAGTNHGLFRSTDHGASFQQVALPTGEHGKPAAGPFGNWISSVVAKPGKPNEVTVAVGFFYGKYPLPNGAIASPGNGLYRSTNSGASFTPMNVDTQLSNPGSSTDPVGRIVLAYGKAAGQQDVLWAAVSDAGLSRGRAPAGLDLLQDTAGQKLNQTSTQFNGLYRSDDDGGSWTVKATPQTLESSPNSMLAAYGPLGYGIGVQGSYNLWVDTDPKVPDQVYLGLEEVFQGMPALPGSPGSAPYSFTTIQRYADLCGFITYTQNVTNGASCPDQTPVAGGQSTHPDQHAALVVPTTTGSRIYTGNDGGFFRQDSHPITPADTGDQNGTGFDNQHWVTMNTLSTTQPWNVTLLPDDEVLVGLQDNGVALIPKGSNHGIEVCGGDGINVLPTPNPDVFFCSYTGASMYVTKDHGKNVTGIPPDLVNPAFLSPAEIDPTDPNHLVAAAQNVEETTKGADTQVLYDPVLTGSVVQSDWVQSYDAGNSPTTNPATKKPFPWLSSALAVRGAAVYDAVCGTCRGAFSDPTWIHSRIATNVKPGCAAKKADAACWHLAAGRGLPHGYVTGIAIDPTNIRTIYVAIGELNPYGYDPRKTGTQRVLVSHDAGESFTDISRNLPRGSAYGIVWRAGSLVVATDTGVYTAPAKSGSWEHLGSALPGGIVVRDLYLEPTGRRMVVALYGRGAWEYDFGAKALNSNSASAPADRAAGVRTQVLGLHQARVIGGLPATGLTRVVSILALVLVGGGLLLARRRRSNPLG